MAVKFILSITAGAALLSTTAMAQVQTNESDPRFAPRTYGSTAITGVDYGQGVTRTYQNAPVTTYQSAPLNTVRIEAPVTQEMQPILSAPITYTDTGVVKAQHFKQGDLSAAEYDALLAEADRVRAYQVTNDNYSSSSYISEPYSIELFEAETSTSTSMSSDAIVYAETTPITSFETSYSSAAHTVIKGDTLYNISKRYAVSVGSLKSTNALSGNVISLGQVLTIPGGNAVISQNNYVAPVTMAWSNSSSAVVNAVEPARIVSSNIYAVLPKDTLYSISRRACVKVGDVIAVNGIADPTALQPGQRLTMPAGHCLN